MVTRRVLSPYLLSPDGHQIHHLKQGTSFLEAHACVKEWILEKKKSGFCGEGEGDEAIMNTVMRQAIET